MYRLHPVDTSDVEAIGAFADEIWHQHYPGIISVGQIRYMLDGGYRPEVIAAELDRGVRWDQVVAAGERVGFCAYEALGARVKLHKIYALERVRGAGVGRLMLRRAEDFAIAQGCADVFLHVAKTNLGSVRFYQRMGYAVERSLVDDIGRGYVMDDYVMANKVLVRRSA